MVNVRRFIPTLSPPKPLDWGSSPIVSHPARIQPITLAEPTPRTPANMAAISSPGVPSFAGFLHYPREKDQAWRDQFARDQTVEEMQNDSVLGGVLMAIEMFVRRVPWHIEPADDSDEAQEIADFYQDCLTRMRGLWPGETMAQVLTFLAWGWCAVEIVYTRREDGRIGWDRWRLIPQHTRARWEFDKTTGDATAMIQSNLYDQTRPSEITVPLDRCIMFRYASRDNSPEGFSPLRVAFSAWWKKQAIETLEGNLFERYGGLPVGRLPSKDITDQTLAYREMQNIITSIKNNAQSGLILASERDDAGNYSQDFDLKSPQGGATVPNADPIVRRYAQEMIGVFLAAITRTGQDGTGSFALADVQSGLFQQGIAAHLDTIADAIQTQEFPRLAAHNAIRPDLIPTIKHGDIEAKDLAALAAYVKALADTGLVEDTPELRFHLHDEAGLPVPTLDELREREEERKKQEEEQAAQAEQARQDALKVAQEGQNGQDDQDKGNVTPLPQRGREGAVVASERVAQLVESDGSMTLADILAVVEWFDDTVGEEHRGLLNARIVGEVEG